MLAVLAGAGPAARGRVPAARDPHLVGALLRREEVHALPGPPRALPVAPRHPDVATAVPGARQARPGVVPAAPRRAQAPVRVRVPRPRLLQERGAVPLELGQRAGQAALVLRVVQAGPTPPGLDAAVLPVVLLRPASGHVEPLATGCLTRGGDVAAHQAVPHPLGDAIAARPPGRPGLAPRAPGVLVVGRPVLRPAQVPRVLMRPLLQEGARVAEGPAPAVPPRRRGADVLPAPGVPAL
mmetsp:Transcript_65636/g.203366  ORF Transcript_65636/g.203366 Transcript_65636/m.203366 type:complete len:239 (-) Transcript_65636:1280-1996(-)